MNAEGVFKGKNISEIKAVTDKLYSIDFPIPVLKKILTEIAKECNDSEKTNFILHNDGAFSMNQFIFTDYEELIESQNAEIFELEEYFRQFCETSELKINNTESLFLFIEKNKFTLSKYISHKQHSNGHDYTAEAQFVNFFKNIPSIYDKIKNIYLGSIIAGYIEYNSDEAEREIELLFDTNFLVGLIDLNTPESTHTCRTLLDIAKQQKFKIRVLIDTIEETKSLLDAKAEFYDKSFLQKKINPEDVYNACDRRNLNKSDLERIADNLENEIAKFGISIIYHTEKLRNEARFTEEYRMFENLRNTKKAALHDATAILYINKTRKYKIKEFDSVNAWFVNNSVSVDGDNIFLKNGFQPESIKADDLLNILWLSNPQINKKIEGVDLAEIGLTSVISLTLNSNLPKSKIIRELDDNIHKYAKEEISDTDIIRVATRITNKQLRDIEVLNELAETDKAEFVKRLEDEANKQKRIEDARIKKLENVFHEISIRTEELEKSKKEFQEKSEGIDKIINEKNASTSKVTSLEKELLIEKNKNIEVQRLKWIDNKVGEWRNRAWKEFLLMLLIFSSGALYILNKSNWNFDEAATYLEQMKSDVLIGGLITILGFVFSAITVKSLVDKYRNHSNIKNFKEGLVVPHHLRELK